MGQSERPKLLRVAGGPHLTFPEMVRRYESGESLAGIPNVMVHSDKLEEKRMPAAIKAHVLSVCR